MPAQRTSWIACLERISGVRRNVKCGTCAKRIGAEQDGGKKTNAHMKWESRGIVANEPMAFLSEISLFR